jgi:hypothetical protein
VSDHPIYQIDWPGEKLVKVPIRKMAYFVGIPQERIAEAQRAYDMAKPGECVQVDEELWPYINRTDKNVAMFSDEVTDFPRTEK